jgi:hypothetical protein
MRTRFTPHIATVLLALFWTSCPAHIAAAAPKAKKTAAERPSDAESLALQARGHFADKDFDAAAKLFMQAYAKDPKPVLVYNAARAYEEGGKKGDAAGLFRLYTTIAKDEEGIANARERLQALEGNPVADSAPQAALVEPGAQNEAAPQWPRWALTGVAAAAVATGVALIFMGSADSEDTAAMPIKGDDDVTTYNERFDAAETKWNAGVAVTAVGVGLAAWATWMHLRSEPPASTWRIEAGPRSAKLTLRF